MLFNVPVKICLAATLKVHEKGHTGMQNFFLLGVGSADICYLEESVTKITLTKKGLVSFWGPNQPCPATAAIGLESVSKQGEPNSVGCISLGFFF